MFIVTVVRDYGDSQNYSDHIEYDEYFFSNRHCAETFSDLIEGKYVRASDGDYQVIYTKIRETTV